MSLAAIQPSFLTVLNMVEVLIIIVIAIYIIFYLTTSARLEKIRKKDQAEFLDVSEKYENYPIFRSYLRHQRILMFGYLKRWSEMEDTLKLINLEKSSRKVIVFIYIRCIIAAIHDNQLPIAASMLAKIENMQDHEITLAKAIYEYKKGNTDLCRQILKTTNIAYFDAYYLGFYNMYLGLTSQGEQQQEFFDAARQSGNKVVLEELNNALETTKD